MFIHLGDVLFGPSAHEHTISSAFSNFVSTNIEMRDSLSLLLLLLSNLVVLLSSVLSAAGSKREMGFLAFFNPKMKKLCCQPSEHEW